MSRTAAMAESMRQYGPPVMLLAGLVIVWEGLVYILAIPPWLLPAPSGIALALWRTAPLLGPHVLQTVKQALLGLSVAVVVGVTLATAIDLWPWLRRALYPLLVISQTIPILALAPLLIIWFGFGMTPKVIIVALFCFFPIAINTADGLSSADPELLSLLQAMGAGRGQIWRKVRLPASLPYFFSGLRIAAAYSVVGAIIGEWVGGNLGLGIYMLRSSNAFKTEQVFAAIVISSLISLALFGLVYLAERLLLPWYHTGKRNNYQ